MSDLLDEAPSLAETPGEAVPASPPPADKRHADERLSPDTRVKLLLQRAAHLYKAGEFDEAANISRKVLELSPTEPNALHLLGMTHHTGGDHRMAMSLVKGAAALDPYELYFYNLGIVAISAGEIETAIASYRHALRLEPNYDSAAANLIFALDLYQNMTPELLLEERRKFNDKFCAALTAASPPHANNRDPNRRLNVGFVSGDFKVHSAPMAFMAMIVNHDPKHVKLHLYSTMPLDRRDGLTVELEKVAAVWTEAHGVSDVDLADQIRADQIDVLVDLAAFSAYGRPLVFARKPAPIQITGWGYAAGTGLDCMDYLVADAITVPPEFERYYSEQILRMPCMLAFDPGGSPPDIGPSPFERNHCITFGFLGRPVKLNMQMLALWARIMRRVPNSRLLLKGDEYRDPILRERISETLVSMGIEIERLQLLPGTNLQEHRATYNLVDIALDTSPNGGGITTLEATLMGVPTVTMLGKVVPSRLTASILSCVGLSDHPTTTDGYVEAAVALANDPEQLARLRLTLRPALLGSVICDQVGYARIWERRIRDLWRQWCREQKAAA